MKSVGIITFHASHNYGSMLQAYALQQTVRSLGFDCRIINLRTPVQKRMYRPFYRQAGPVWKIVALRYPLLALAERRKHRLFERFMREHYSMTETEYSDAGQLRRNPPTFDYYISGSDQIWNTMCVDFSKSYFLDFVKSGKRIAYAPSMGGKIERTHENYGEFISECLARYDSISVREPGTARRVKQICGIEAAVTVDPTLLLPGADWNTLAGERPLVEGDYLLLYNPWPSDDNFESYAQALSVAGEKGVKVVCTMPNAYRRWSRFSNFKFFTAVGPSEFLNLIRFSKYVVCGSFHAVVFSLVFAKPFYACNGMTDSRISNLLEMTGLQRCADKLDERGTFDFPQIHARLKPYIDSSRRFLIDSLK